MWTPDMAAEGEQGISKPFPPPKPAIDHTDVATVFSWLHLAADRLENVNFHAERADALAIENEQWAAAQRNAVAETQAVSQSLHMVTFQRDSEAQRANAFSEALRPFLPIIRTKPPAEAAADELLTCWAGSLSVGTVRALRIAYGFEAPPHGDAASRETTQ